MYADTARRWNELVRGYSAPGSDTVVYQVPDRIQKPLGPTARRERARIDALVRRQAALGVSVLAATLCVLGGATLAGSPPLVLAAALAATVTALVTVARLRRLRDRRNTLAATDAQDTCHLARFSRWLIALAHQAAVRATVVDGGPAGTADRMAEALYQFSDDVRTLERVISSSSMVADTYGRLRRVHDHADPVGTLLDAQAHILSALEVFESTAREVVLAAHAEHAGAVCSLLDLQAEALVRREALAALDGVGLRERPRPPSRAS